MKNKNVKYSRRSHCTEYYAQQPDEMEIFCDICHQQTKMKDAKTIDDLVRKKILSTKLISKNCFDLLWFGWVLSFNHNLD